MIFRINNIILFVSTKIVMSVFENSDKTLFPSQASTLGLGPGKTSSSLLMLLLIEYALYITVICHACLCLT